MFAFLLAVGLAFGPDSPTSRDLLSRLAQTWSAVRDYRVDIDANELVGTGWNRRQVRYSLLKPDRAKMEILDGSARGTVLTWYGSDRIVVRPGGLLGFLRLSFGLNDPKVRSPRGNTLLAPDFARVLDCFLAHHEEVRILPDEAPGGRPATVLVFEHAPGPVCPTDSEQDVAVTRDVVTIDGATGMPVRRERFEGERSVERWDLRNLQTNVGLKNGDF